MSLSGLGRTYRILYEEVDEGDVEILNLASSDLNDVESYRYPRAGTANAHCTLKIMEFQMTSQGEITNVHSLVLQVLYTNVVLKI